ncbi:hypothetical protein [Lactiplantibacillus plantarum]|uniref:hypothetical protein n=1 Tax=Lactiplantibacillus plantarum TaxID=1590 RepID=UPI001BAD702C|nr:hypothetical protein [Lactiplantibacillus plantarum]MBS0936364.1 hypothetical protein [Lactiplantibacillus plantarum]MBS0943793.1 hypothetical protein [Lactiplantibacillus plantarum]
MEKIKRWAFDFWYSQTPEDRVIRKSSFYVTIGVFTIIVGIFFMITSHRMPKTYADISGSNQTEIATLKQAAKTNEPVTLILRRTGCGACNNAQSTIVKNVYWHRLTRPNRKFVILDLKRMTNKQLMELAVAVPDVKTKRGIPTPVVANLERSNQRWHAEQISMTDDKQAIKNVFSQIGF